MNRIFVFSMFLLSLEIAGYASSNTLPLLPAVARFIEQYPDAGTALDCQPATESLFGVKQHVILTTG
ncbi:MAG: hypothetical protein NTX50_22735 [Candidatus Sumerlaeota bacterium]|nr:hypothetical protein [Candidatus Sumerlaeota bacterium]